MVRRKAKRVNHCDVNKYFKEFASMAKKHNVEDEVPDPKYGVKVKSKNGDTLIVYPFLLNDLFLSERRRGIALKELQKIMADAKHGKT